MTSRINTLIATTFIVIGLGLFTTTFIAQEKATQPEVAPTTITSDQKTKIENYLLKMENSQMKAQLAQQDFENAKSELTTLVKSLQKDGYDLNIQTGVYTKKVAKN